MNALMSRSTDDRKIDDSSLATTPTPPIDRSNAMTRLFPTLAILGLLTLTTACGDKTPTAAPSGAEPKTMLGKAVGEAIEEARRELATENIGLSTGATMPKGEITPQGDLLIGGEPVKIDEKQRALLLEHRKRVVAIAEAGMLIGIEGADLAGKAITEALGSVFSGDSEKIEKKIEAEAKEIESSAARLCELLPPMLASQEALKQALPAFEPYATMTQAEIDECRKDNGRGGEAVANVVDNAFNGKLDIQVNGDQDKGDRADGDTASNRSANPAAEAEAASAEAGAQADAGAAENGEKR